MTTATATAPVTVTTQAGTTFTVHMPLHGTTAVYDASAHTAAVAQLAAAPAAAPASTPDLSGSTIAGLSGGVLVGLGLLVWTIARWKHSSKDHHMGFIKGIAVAILLGGFGLFATLSSTVTATGNSTGSVISNFGSNGH